jgi:hypothetical protein
MVGILEEKNCLRDIGLESKGRIKGNGNKRSDSHKAQNFLFR